MKRIKNIWREPLVHFLLIGAALFLLFSFTNNPAGDNPNRIVVSPGQVEQLSSNFSRTWLRPPTEDEMAGLVREHVRDEVYYREALAMGLDQNDTLIRRRMRQKMEFILEDLTSESEPNDQVLMTFLQQHPDKFRLEPWVSFRQVYLNPDNRPNLEADARIMMADLRSGAKPETLGDPTLKGYEFRSAPQSVIARSFGNAFAQEIIALEPEDWTGPLYSVVGGHLVLVTDRREGRLPELTEIRAEVEREYLARRRKELKDTAYHKILEGYEVVIEQPKYPDPGSGAAAAATTAEAGTR
ncbi:MAG: peptidylprolyl isomerase [Desulfobacterales bacterium]|jgi:hypothetical protein